MNNQAASKGRRQRDQKTKSRKQKVKAALEQNLPISAEDLKWHQNYEEK